MFFQRKRRKPSIINAPIVKAKTRDGFAGSETNDCSVWTLAALLCVSYAEAHALLARAGRKPGSGVWSEQMILAASFAGYTMREHSRPRIVRTHGEPGGYEWTSERPPTARCVLDHVPARGHFYVSTGHHAFAVVDGVIYDNGALRPRCSIKRVYELVIS